MQGVTRERRQVTAGRHRAVPQRRNAMAGVHRPMPQRRHLTAGAVFVAASAVAISPMTPVAPWGPGLPAAQRAVQLAADGSLLNVPFNLFQALVNVPANEIQALQGLGNSLFFSGTWFAASGSNIWGEDPGDPGHFMSVINMALPFPELSGQGDPLPGYGDFSWDDAAAGHLGLGQQIILMLNAQIPVSASSDADWSGPLIPTAPITGFAAIDQTIWNALIWTGQQQYPMINDWFKVPFSDLQDGYTFGNAVDPSAGVGENGAVPTDDFYQIPGTHPTTVDQGFGLNDDGWAVNANGNVIQLMPWANEEFKLDLAYPFQRFWESLQAPIDPNTYMQGFQLPDLTEFGRAIQTLLASSVVAFDPWVVGSPFCLQVCGSIPDMFSMPGVVKSIGDLWPGNASIDHWLELLNTPGTGPGGLDNPFGMTNNPVQTTVNMTNLFMVGIRTMFSLGNPLPDEAPDGVNTPIAFPVSPVAQALIDLMQKDIFPGVDIAGQDGSSVQDLAGAIAAAFNYTPIDYSDPNWLIDAVPPNTIEEWLASLFSGLGL